MCIAPTLSHGYNLLDMCDSIYSYCPSCPTCENQVCTTRFWLPVQYPLIVRAHTTLHVKPCVGSHNIVLDGCCSCWSNPSHLTISCHWLILSYSEHFSCSELYWDVVLKSKAGKHVLLYNLICSTYMYYQSENPESCGRFLSFTGVYFFIHKMMNRIVLQ